MPEIRKRPLTGEAMSTFGKRYPHFSHNDNRPTPRTPSQEFDMGAAWKRVRAWLDEMYADEMDEGT